MTALIAYFAILFSSLLTFIRTSCDTLSILWILLALVMFAAITVFCWWECQRTWRTGVSR